MAAALSSLIHQTMEQTFFPEGPQREEDPQHPTTGLAGHPSNARFLGDVMTRFIVRTVQMFLDVFKLSAGFPCQEIV